MNRDLAGVPDGTAGKTKGLDDKDYPKRKGAKIDLKNENALQDTLRLLTLWFKYGAHDEVSHAMATGFTSVEVDTWLEVIPQVRHSTWFTRLGLNPATRL